LPIAIGYTVRFYNLKASVIKACKGGNAKIITVTYRYLPLPTVAFSSDYRHLTVTYV